MSLQPEELMEAKSVPSVEPLFFRSMEEFAEIAAPLFQQASAVEEIAAPFDFEASLRAAHEQGKREAMAHAAEQMQQQIEAARVVHREAAMDPMLLAGAARVALDQVADSSEAVLRVAASDAAQWNETLKPSSKGMVIEADEEMQRGEAVLKTRSGTVQLGLKAQLQEIERGFFELLGRRPALAI